MKESRTNGVDSSNDGTEPVRWLRSKGSEEPNTLLAQRWIEQVGPLKPSRTAEARVKRRLQETEMRPRSKATRLLPIVRLAPVLGLLLAASAAAAGGVLLSAQLLGHAREAGNEESVPEKGLGTPEGTEPINRVIQLPEISPTETPEPTVTKAKELAGSPATPTKPPQIRPPHFNSKRDEKPSEKPDQAGAALIVEALKARNQRNYPRVSALSEEYRTSYPRGPLAEEALGLGMEAAAAMRTPRAPKLARRYLQNYPGGRFRAIAQQLAPPED